MKHNFAFAPSAITMPEDKIKTVADYEAEGLRPPTSLLERAVNTGRASEALAIIRAALCITPDEFTLDLIDAHEFRRATEPQRFKMLAEYLWSECFAAIDRSERQVPMPDDLARTLAATKD